MIARGTEKSEEVLVVDLGTYCDHALVSSAIADILIQPSIKLVTYVTDSANTRQDNVCNVDVFKYSAPDFLWTLGADLADPKMNVSLWAIKNPMRALALSTFMGQASEIVNNVAISKRKSIKKIVVTYPAIGIALRLPKEFYSRVVVLHYAPTYPNSTVPWIFDSCLKDPSWRMFRTSADFNAESHRSYASALATYNSLSQSDMNSFLTKSQHVACWDPALLSREVAPINGIKVVSVQPLTSSKTCVDTLKKKLVVSEKERPVHPKWLSSGEPFVFVTFGSYSGESVMRKATEALLPALEEWASNKSANVVLALKEPLSIHVKKHKRHSRIIFHSDFIDYSFITPHAALVVFTGSMCLHMSCISNSTPMLFVPMIAEQYFWAKNHASETDVPYVDVGDLKNTVPKNDQEIDTIISKSKRMLHSNVRTKWPSIGAFLTLQS